MSMPRTRPSRPEDLPATWYCKDCDAMLPLERFAPKKVQRRDGSVCYRTEHQCRACRAAYWRAWRAQVPPQAAAVPAGGGRGYLGHPAPEDPAVKAERDAKRAAFVGAIRRWVAEQWGQTPEWLLARDRSPEQVEARALVVAILYYDHGFGITEAGLAIERDHSTALHLMGKYMHEPLFQELLADYRRFREQRRAARARKAG